MTRGKKSNVTIAGHTLTFAEVYTLNVLRGAITNAARGESIPLREIFSGWDDKSIAKRHSARRLAALGVLSASGIELIDDVVKGKPHDTNPARPLGEN